MLCTPEKEAEAQAAGADYVGLDEYVEKIKSGWTDIDVIICTCLLYTSGLWLLQIGEPVGVGFLRAVVEPYVVTSGEGTPQMCIRDRYNPLLLSPERLMIARSAGSRKMRGRGLPAWGWGVTVPDVYKRQLFARTGFQRCDYFLCHIALKLFDFTMNGHLLQERVVFLALQTVGGVFLVLGRDVAGHSRNTASFLLSLIHI